MSRRELRRHAGRLAIVGFTGHDVPGDLRRLAADFDLAGVIYFARNVVTPRQVAELSRQVADLKRDWPLWISVDQEGGRVARLKSPFTEWPPAITLGRSGDERLAERFGAALAAELLAVGINLDYAPVLDVHTNPANPVIGDRALAEKAQDAARLGAAVLRGLQSAGVAACGKHFPGHGDTSLDSHEALPVIEHERPRLEEVELVPFVRAIAERVATMMTAHVLVPALDEQQPASLSKAVVNDLLKMKLGYDGVVFCDDLGMKAVSATRPLPEATVDALVAGNDVVLLCNSTIDEQHAAIEAIIRAAESGQLTESRLDDALARQRRVKERFFGRRAQQEIPIAVVGCAEHQAVAEEMAAWR
ncbi:MAG TPA: beta-N-acetylhexosaminidase [Vicinamibacterales bacterium]